MCTLCKSFTVFLISKSVTSYSLIKVYGTNSNWRHFTSRTKQTRSDLYLLFMMHYRVVAMCIEEKVNALGKSFTDFLISKSVARWSHKGIF